MKEPLFRRCGLDRTSYNGFEYPKEGWVEAKDYNTEEECEGGIRALRVGDDLSFLTPSMKEEGLWQVFTDYVGLISLGNKVKIQRGYVKTGIDILEYRDEFLKDPEWAHWYAFYVDRYARDDTRKAACGDSGSAYRYALKVDKCPRDGTRKAACGNPVWAHWYALEVDKCAREDTRKAACGNPVWAHWYALKVDKCPRDDTRKAACGNPERAYRYASEVDKCVRDDTREAAYKDPCWKERYQEWEESLSKK